MKLATGNPATVKSCRIAAGMPSASTSEEGPNLLALDRRAPDSRPQASPPTNAPATEKTSASGRRSPKKTRQAPQPQTRTPTQHRHLPPTQGGAFKKKHDARVPSPPNPEIWVLTRVPKEGGRGIYLSIASKEEDGVQDVADAVTATAGQGFLPARAPCPATPTTPTRTPEVMALGWVPHEIRPPSSDLPRGRRGNHRGPSTLHRLHAAHATEETVLSISKRSPPPGTAPPSPRRGRRLRCPSPHREER
nr:protein transport protein sec31-like [Lolium perenne]